MKKKAEYGSGSLFKSHGAWFISFREYRVIDGVVQRKRVTKRVCDADGVSKADAREHAEDLLRKEIRKVVNIKPEKLVTLTRFVEDKFFPDAARRDIKKSTIRSYRIIWDAQIKPFCEDLWIGKLTTPDIKEILARLAATGRFNINSLTHCKNFLSGVFRLAIEEGYYDGANPVPSWKGKGKALACRPAGETYAYSNEEISAMLAVLPEPAATIVAMAAWTGARKGELMGAAWQHLKTISDPATGQKSGILLVKYSVYEGEITNPKTDGSETVIPIIPK